MIETLIQRRHFERKIFQVDMLPTLIRATWVMFASTTTTIYLQPQAVQSAYTLFPNQNIAKSNPRPYHVHRQIIPLTITPFVV